MFQNSRIPESGFGAAVKVSYMDPRLTLATRKLESSVFSTHIMCCRGCNFSDVFTTLYICAYVHG